jgi:hypothetical protein
MKTIKHTIRDLTMSALCAFALFGAPSLGAQELPADLFSGPAAVQLGATTIDPLSLSTAKVQPILLSDSGSRTQVGGVLSQTSQLKASDAQRSRVSASVPSIKAPAASGDQGFGFAGESSEIDTISLQYGYLLGMLPLLQATSPDKFQETLKTLQGVAQLNDLYGKNSQAAIKAFTAAASQGKFDERAYMDMILGGTQDMAAASDSSSERMHGYLVIGLWSGLAMLAAEADAIPAALPSTGNTLVMLLEKDANFGGSDLQLAASLKAVIAELASPSPNKDTLQKHVMAMMEVKADK